MTDIRGQREYDSFRKGEPLTHEEAILAMCYECHSDTEGAIDCESVSCPLYPFMPYRTWEKKLKDHKAEIMAALD